MTTRLIASAHTNYLFGQTFKELADDSVSLREAALYAPKEGRQHPRRFFFGKAPIRLSGRGKRTCPNQLID